MSSTGPSLARSRSLRKPAPGTATDLSQKPPVASSTTTAAAARNVSPSRLPSLKPASRLPPTAAAPVPTSNAAPSFLKKTRPLPGLPRSGTVTAPTTAARPHATQPPKPHDAQPPPLTSRSRYPPNASASANIAGPGAAVKRPTSSGGLTSPSKPAQGPAPGGRAFGHARAKSTTTASISSTATTRTISNAPVLRPPSQTSTTVPKQRPASIHGRPPSATERHPTKPTTTTTQPSSRAVSATKPPDPPKPAPVARDAPRLRPKPAFSTLQQHFSPLRRAGPKTLTAAYLAPPSPSKLPSNVASSAETARLQTELLQLHLLHRDAAPVHAAWHASARLALADRHAALAAQARDVSALEARGAEHADAAALLSWGSGALDTRVQTLDPLLTVLWTLHTPGGRYARLARHFSRWCDRLADAEAARARLAERDIASLPSADESIFLAGPIEAEWKDQAAHLTRRLEGWARQLRDLRADGPGTSSIHRTLGGCGVLVADMLTELAVMEDIERAAVEREREWIRRMNREDDDGGGERSLVSGRRYDTPRAGALWRTF